MESSTEGQNKTTSGRCGDQGMNQRIASSTHWCLHVANAWVETDQDLEHHVCLIHFGAVYCCSGHRVLVQLLPSTGSWEKNVLPPIPEMEPSALWSCSDHRRGTAAHHDERQNSGWQICTSQVQTTLWRLCYILVHQDIRDVESLCKNLRLGPWAAWRPGLKVKYKIVWMRNNEMKTVLIHHQILFDKFEKS